jgi:hypothetical protein
VTLLSTKPTQHELYQQSRISEKGVPLYQVSKRLQSALRQRDGIPTGRGYATAYGWDGRRYSARLNGNDGRVYIHDSTFERYATLYVAEPPGLLWWSGKWSSVIGRWWFNSCGWMLWLERMVGGLGKRAK